MRLARTARFRRQNLEVVNVAILDEPDPAPFVPVLARRDLIMLQRLFRDLDKLKGNLRITNYANLQRRVRESLDALSDGGLPNPQLTNDDHEKQHPACRQRRHH